MTSKLNELINNLELQINVIIKSRCDKLEIIQEVLTIVANSCNIFLHEISKYEFKNKTEEVLIFKEFKPRLFSYLFYYNNLFKIESEKPNVDSYLKKYYEELLLKLYKEFEANKSFYSYYRLRETTVDETCFVRTNQGEILYRPNGRIIYYNNNLIVINDLMFASLLANDLTEKYIQLELDTLNEKNFNLKSFFEELGLDSDLIEWTATSTDFVETMYAFHSALCINNGKIEILKLITFMAKIFKVPINDPYKTFDDICSRKNRTKFLDKLKLALIQKMEVKDERLSLM